jgi:ribosomal protein L10
MKRLCHPAQKSGCPGAYCTRWALQVAHAINREKKEEIVGRLQEQLKTSMLVYGWKYDKVKVPLPRAPCHVTFLQRLRMHRDHFVLCADARGPGATGAHCLILQDLACATSCQTALELHAVGLCMSACLRERKYHCAHPHRLPAVQVKDLESMRRNLPDGCKMIVTKNRLLRVAIDTMEEDALKTKWDGLKGQKGMNAYVFVEEAAVREAVKAYGKLAKALKVRDRVDATLLRWRCLASVQRNATHGLWHVRGCM